MVYGYLLVGGFLLAGLFWGTKFHKAQKLYGPDGMRPDWSVEDWDKYGKPGYGPGRGPGRGPGYAPGRPGEDGEGGAGAGGGGYVSPRPPSGDDFFVFPGLGPAVDIKPDEWNPGGEETWPEGLMPIQLLPPDSTHAPDTHPPGGWSVDYDAFLHGN